MQISEGFLVLEVLFKQFGSLLVAPFDQFLGHWRYGYQRKSSIPAFALAKFSVCGINGSIISSHFVRRLMKIELHIAR